MTVVFPCNGARNAAPVARPPRWRRAHRGGARVLLCAVQVLLCAALAAAPALARPPRGEAPERARQERPAERQAPGSGGAGRAHAGEPLSFGERVDALLQREGLADYRVGLLLFSVSDRRYLYQREIGRPLIAASNTKLVTTYAALKTLSPDYRWRTRFYRVREHDDAGGPSRQGLLVEGSGDPTLSVRDLDRVALILRSYGIERLDGGLYYDDGLYAGQPFPAAWGDVERGEPWFAPVSPFIVEKNVVDFVIADRRDAGFEVYPSAPAFRVRSRLHHADLVNPQVSVEQQWDGGGPRFVLSGALPASPEPYFLSAAVKRPVRHFHTLFRASLRRAGIEGPMPLRTVSGETALERTYLHTRVSPPLREVITEVNRHSSNLAAEVLLRTMGQREKPAGVTAADGLAVVREVIARNFPRDPEQVRLVDGSGLSRQNRLSPLFLVRLLHRVFQDFRIRAEYLNSLPLAGQDGTLQYREYPYRLQGRLRAKSGTLNGVANLSGYLELPRDVVIFSFLINGADIPFLPLQRAQDRVMTGIYDALVSPERSPRVAASR